MTKIYKRYCDRCGEYYEGRGKFYCSLECRYVSNSDNGCRLTLSDGSWYPKIPVICGCDNSNCHEICWNGSKFKAGHQTKTKERREQQSQRRKGLTPWNKDTHGLMPEPWNKGLTKEDDERIKMQAKNIMGSKHPHYGKRITPEGWIKTQRQLESFRNVLEIQKSNPELHPNRIMGKKGFVSKPQKMLFELIKQIYSDAELEYPIRVNKGYIKFADIGVPSLKLDFEYDGAHWHNVNKDVIRQKEIEEAGWKVIRFNDKDKNKLNLELIKFKLSELNIDIN